MVIKESITLSIQIEIVKTSIVIHKNQCSRYIRTVKINATIDVTSKIA